MRDKLAGSTRRFSVSLSLRLFLWTLGTILISFAAYAWFSVRAATAEWDRHVLASAARFSDLILRSTSYHMLLNRKEDVHQIIRSVGQQDGVSSVRIYDKQGSIVYSADEREIGGRVDLHAEACSVCHAGSAPLRSVAAVGRSRVYDDPVHGRVLGLIVPIENHAECTTAPCHAHPGGQTVLGVLDTKMSLAGADVLLARVRRRVLVAGCLTALVAGGVSAVFLARGVRAPVRRLIDGVERVAAGDLSARIDVQSDDEMGQLADAFHRMTRELQLAQAERAAWSTRLESTLAERTAELGRTQRQVVHMEKMASLGKLAATVAHEVNNPLAGILSYTRLAERTLAEGRQAGTDDELRRYLDVIRKETARCGDIVRNLLVFARRTGAEMVSTDLQPIVERALALVRHHVEMGQLRLETDLADEAGALVCDADQVQQALVALLVNAVEATPPGGTITVRTRADAERVRVEVCDTGHGIEAEDLPRVFEPFFTTKESSSGTGLGLAVVYGIAQRHGGDVEVESSPGSGSRFTLLLARHPRPARPRRPRIGSRTSHGGAYDELAVKRQNRHAGRARARSARANRDRQRARRRRRVLGARLARELVPQGRLPHGHGIRTRSRRWRAWTTGRGTSCCSTSRCRAWTAWSCSAASTWSTPRSR